MKLQHLTLLLLTITISWLLTACGYKGPVRPLAAPIPAPVKGAELRQQGDSLLLSWRLPDHNLDGSPLKSAPQLDIYRMSYDPTNDCPECIDRSTLLVSINPELPAPARRIEDRYLFADQQLLIGTGYRYKLVPRSAEGSGQPVILNRTFLQPPAAPQQLLVVAEDRAARLSWQPYLPAKGETLLGYRLYRHQEGVEPSPVPLASEPLAATGYEDFGLENGSRYYYRVRALVKRGNQTLEGFASPEAAVTPKAGI